MTTIKTTTIKTTTIKTTTTACPLDCYGACRIKVGYTDNAICTFEADRDHPLTRGIFCSKGKGHVKRMQHPDRVLEPQLRTSEGFRPIPWDDAMSLLAERIRSAMLLHGHQSVAGFTGGAAGGKLRDVMDLFLRHLGGGTQFSGGLCLSAGLEAQTLDFGNALGHSPFDLINAKTIVLWGKNPADTHFHLLPHIQKAKEAGAKVILIDPVATGSKRFADTVIQPLPGADWALAAAVIQQLLQRGLCGEGLPRAVQTKHPEILRAIAGFDREALLRECGLEAEAVETLVNAYGSPAPCATYLGYGLQRHCFGGTTVRLIDLLGVLSGQVGNPGGGLNYGNFANRGLLDWSWAEPDFAPKPRYLNLGNFGKALTAANDPPVKVMMIACGNPATQMSDTAQVMRALNAMETVVVIDHFMSDTAKLADLVLPATYFLESEDIMASNMWNSTIHYLPQVTAPRGEARPELQIFSELAIRLDLHQFPQKTSSEWLANLLKPLSKDGIDLERLKTAGWLPSPRQQDIPWHDHRFQTVDGQFHPLPLESIEQLKAHLCDTRPLDTVAFVTRHRIDSINSQHTMTLPHAVPEVHLHPDTADRFGFSGNEAIEAHSSCGHFAGTVRIDDGVKPGVAAALQGAWRNASKASVNDVIITGTSDIGGQVLLNATRIVLKKKEASDAHHMPG